MITTAPPIDTVLGENSNRTEESLTQLKACFLKDWGRAYFHNHSGIPIRRSTQVISATLVDYARPSSGNSSLNSWIFWDSPCRAE